MIRIIICIIALAIIDDSSVSLAGILDFVEINKVYTLTQDARPGHLSASDLAQGFVQGAVNQAHYCKDA